MLRKKSNRRMKINKRLRKKIKTMKQLKRRVSSLSWDIKNMFISNHNKSLKPKAMMKNIKYSSKKSKSNLMRN